MKKLCLPLAALVVMIFLQGAATAAAAPTALGIPCTQNGDNSYTCSSSSPRSTASRASEYVATSAPRNR